MGANSNIEWTDHTFNPVIGCTRVSAGCDNCYAARENARRKWVTTTDAEGKEVAAWDGPRRRTGESNWRQPLKWNGYCRKMGIRQRVFCASLSDWADNQWETIWRVDLLQLIMDTPHLDWLLLSKRPQNIIKLLRQALQFAVGKLREWLERWLGGEPPANVWLGATVENQEEADRRIPHLLSVPAKVHFLSCEPLLGPVDLRQWMGHEFEFGKAIHSPCAVCGKFGGPLHRSPPEGGVKWVIVGGESGSKDRRKMPMDAARSLRGQCRAAGVPFFGKQNDKVDPLPDDLFIREVPTP